MFTACISNIVLWFVLQVSGQYWPFAFTSNKYVQTSSIFFILFINRMKLVWNCRSAVTMRSWWEHCRRKSTNCAHRSETNMISWSLMTRHWRRSARRWLTRSVYRTHDPLRVVVVVQTVHASVEYLLNLCNKVHFTCMWNWKVQPEKLKQKSDEQESEKSAAKKRCTTDEMVR